MSKPAFKNFDITKTRTERGGKAVTVLGEGGGFTVLITNWHDMGGFEVGISFTPRDWPSGPGLYPGSVKWGHPHLYDTIEDAARAADELIERHKEKNAELKVCLAQLVAREDYADRFSTGNWFWAASSLVRREGMTADEAVRRLVAQASQCSK